MLRVGLGKSTTAISPVGTAVLLGGRASSLRLKKIELGGVRWKRGGEQANKVTRNSRMRKRQSQFSRKKVVDPFSLHDTMSKEAWNALPRTPTASLEQHIAALTENSPLQPQSSWQNTASVQSTAAAAVQKSAAASSNTVQLDAQRKADLEAFEKAVEAAAAFRTRG